MISQKKSLKQCFNRFKDSVETVIQSLLTNKIKYNDFSGHSVILLPLVLCLTQSHHSHVTLFNPTHCLRFSYYLQFFIDLSFLSSISSFRVYAFRKQKRLFKVQMLIQLPKIQMSTTFSASGPQFLCQVLGVGINRYLYQVQYKVKRVSHVIVQVTKKTSIK